MATPGIYLLLIRLARQAVLAIAGAPRPFPAGWYVYTGRALNGLEGRLARHLRTREPRHWHLDALLAAGRVLDLQVQPGSDPAAECRAAALVGSWPAATAISGFGASDCACPTHLHRFAARPAGALAAPAVVPHLPEMVARLRRHEPPAAWGRRDPFQTLAACILSLRTQDPVTDAAADRLFAEFATPQALASAAAETVARRIFPVGMYRQKAQTLVAISQQLLERFAGQVPAEIAALLTLPGVGRKTANLVRSFAYGLDAICVDTHVHRISNRWGLVRTATPDETELELRRLLPREFWRELNPRLVRHGQELCRPRRPRCSACFLRGLCRYDELRAAQAVIAAIPGAPPHPSLGTVLPAPA